jgi:hypothetical protein
MASVERASVTDRMMRAARVEPHLFEEVERDESATSQAATVVVIVAIASGIGALLRAIISPTPGQNVILSFIFGIISALIVWVIWAYITYFVGTRLFNGTATPGEMLRTLGFAQTPGVFNILSFIPFVGGIISLVVLIWSIWAGIVAVRQALDFDTGKAVLTVIIGVIVAVVIVAILGVIIGAPLAMMSS